MAHGSIESKVKLGKSWEERFYMSMESVESSKVPILVKKMVGPCGLEPQTSTVSRWRSSQLSYGPTDLFGF
jgi:hypothetical protein